MRKNKYMRYRVGISKCLAVGVTAAMCMAMLAGCSSSQSAGSESAASGTEVTSAVSTETDADVDSDSTEAANASTTSTKTEMTVEEMQAVIDEAMSDADIDVTDMFTKRDLAGTYDESEAVKITLSEKTATCSSSDVQIEDGVITIKAAGVYVLSGTLSDGTIVVDAGDDDKVQLVLDGASITAADYAAIYAKNADKVFVTLAEGTDNSLTVSGDYVQTDDNNVDAVIFAKCDLTLGGSGSLTVKDTTGHGIVSKDDLVVTGGTYTIDSQDHCLNGKDSVRIADGTFNLSCDEDGIHAGNDDQQDGYVYIEGGDINISVGDDAIHAEGLLIITGGDIDITKCYEGVEGHKILVTGGDIDVVSSDDGFNAAGGSSSSDSSDDNKGGFGGGPGGNADGNTPPARPDDSGQSIDSLDASSADQNTPPAKPGESGQSIDSSDASSTDQNTPPAKPGESGQGSDNSDPSSTDANTSTSKMDENTQSADDDTNNTDSNRPELPGKGGQPGGSDMAGGPGMGGVDMDADYDAYILITGGTININADGDGIDSNGYLGITGGSIYVLGPSNNGNGALDYGIYAAITGGEIVAVGGSGMAQGFDDESTQCSALINFDEWIDAGETVTLTDSDGKEVFSYKVDKKFNSVVISTADMKQGETYTLTVGDQSSTFTLDDITYSECSGGMQGPGGNSGNGDMQRPDGSSDNGNMQRPGSENGNSNTQTSDQSQVDSEKSDLQSTDSSLQNIGGKENTDSNSQNTDSMSI